MTQVLGYCPPANVSQSREGPQLWQKDFHSLWGRASSPAVKGVPGDVAPAMLGGEDPGCHQGSAHTQIPPDQCGPRLALWGKV